MDKITEIHALEPTTELQISPADRLRLNASSEFKKLNERYKIACGELQAVERKFTADSVEYRAMCRHAGTLKSKTVQFSRVFWGKEEVTDQIIAELYPVPRTYTLQIMINGRQRDIPASLLTITFDQVIDFAKQYGDDLDRQLESIQAMEAGLDRQTAIILWEVDKMYKCIAFFAGIDLDALKNSGFDSEIASIYEQTLNTIIDPPKN